MGIPKLSLQLRYYIYYFPTTHLLTIPAHQPHARRRSVLFCWLMLFWGNNTLTIQGEINFRKLWLRIAIKSEEQYVKANSRSPPPMIRQYLWLLVI